MTSKSAESGLRVHLSLDSSWWFLQHAPSGYGRHIRDIAMTGVSSNRQGCIFFLFSASGSCADTAEKPTDVRPRLGGSQDPRSSGTSRESATALQTTLGLISMTSPRNLQPQRAALMPSFVEFDMSVDGYGYGEISLIWKMIY